MTLEVNILLLIFLETTHSNYDVYQLIQNTEIDRLVVSSELWTSKKHSKTVFYLTKFNITYIS
jgi:hypothetical protein